jgi:hypothetical protein
MTTDLQQFDRLARRSIDPALDSVVAEANKRHSEYAATIQPTATPFRHECLLTITNRDPINFQLAGSLSIAQASHDTVRIEHSFRWVDHGKPLVAATIAIADVTEAEITRLAYEFLDRFFQRISRQYPG